MIASNNARLWELKMARTPEPDAPFEEVFDGAMQAHPLLAGEALGGAAGG